MTALSPMRRAMLDVDAIVGTAERAGIAIRSVDIYTSMPDYITVTVYAADEALTPALAVTLGLTDRHVQGYEDHALESFTGRIGDIAVTTQHAIPLSALSADDLAAVTS